MKMKIKCTVEVVNKKEVDNEENNQDEDCNKDNKDFADKTVKDKYKKDVTDKVHGLKDESKIEHKGDKGAFVVTESKTSTDNAA